MAVYAAFIRRYIHSFYLTINAVLIFLLAFLVLYLTNSLGLAGTHKASAFDIARILYRATEYQISVLANSNAA